MFVPKLVLNAEAISKRWTIPRRARISMIAFSSVPNPFMALRKTEASSMGSKGSAGNTDGWHCRIILN